MTLTSAGLGLLVAGIGLGGVIVGAVVAGGFALLTGWLDSRREHTRWLRERCLDAYLSFYRTIESTPAMHSKETLARGDVTYPQRLVDALADLALLGPRKVESAGSAMMSQAIMAKLNPPRGIGDPQTPEDKRLSKAKALFEREAQKALKINPGAESKDVSAFFKSWGEELGLGDLARKARATKKAESRSEEE